MENKKNNKDLFLECKEDTSKLLDKITQNKKEVSPEKMFDSVINEYKSCLTLSEEVLKDLKYVNASKKIEEAVVSTQQRIKIDIEVIKHIKNNLINPKANDDQKFAEQLSGLQFLNAMVGQKEDIAWSNLTISEFKNNTPSPYVETNSVLNFVLIIFVLSLVLIYLNKNKNNVKKTS